MERKQFIKTMGIACLSCIGVPLVLESCTTVSYVPSLQENGLLKLSKTDLADEKNKPKKVVITRELVEGYPVALYALENNTYSALWLKCTHQGSELNVHGDILSCPSHGSEFTNTGDVLQGPADRKLINFKVTADQKFVYIHLQ